MGQSIFIRKQLVASKPFQKMSTKQWCCNIFDESEENPPILCTVFGETKLEVESAAMIFVKAWKILKHTSDILTGVDKQDVGKLSKDKLNRVRQDIVLGKWDFAKIARVNQVTYSTVYNMNTAIFGSRIVRVYGKMSKTEAYYNHDNISSPFYGSSKFKSKEKLIKGWELYKKID